MKNTHNKQLRKFLLMNQIEINRKNKIKKLNIIFNKHRTK